MLYELLAMQVITSPLLCVWRQPVLQSSAEEGGSGLWEQGRTGATSQRFGSWRGKPGRVWWLLKGEE